MHPVRIIGPTTAGRRVSVVRPLRATPLADGTVQVRDAIGQSWTFPATSVVLNEEQQ